MASTLQNHESGGSGGGGLCATSSRFQSGGFGKKLADMTVAKSPSLGGRILVFKYGSMSFKSSFVFAFVLGIISCQSII